MKDEGLGELIGLIYDKTLSKDDLEGFGIKDTNTLFDGLLVYRFNDKYLFFNEVSDGLRLHVTWDLRRLYLK